MVDFRTQEWVNGSGELGGWVAYLRKNVSLTPKMQRARPHALIINLVYQHQGNDGLPCDDEELRQFDEMEEAIASCFVAECDACFAMVVTSNGTRDLFLFLPKLPSESDVGQRIQSVMPTVNFDFSLHHDPDWRPYHELMPT
jgi:hypothetical protein